MLDEFAIFIEKNQDMATKQALQMFRTHNKDCKPSPIIITADTWGIASVLCYQCQNCSHQCKTKQEKFKWKVKNMKKGPNASYAMNVQYCLALQ